MANRDGVLGLHVVVLGGSVEPDEGLLVVPRDSASEGVGVADVEAGHVVAVGGGHQVVPDGHLVVLLEAGAVGVVVAGDQLGVSVAQVGGPLEPGCGELGVLLDLFAAGVELSEHDHGIGLSEGGGLLEQLQSQVAVLLGPHGSDVAPGEPVHGGDGSPAGGGRVPCVCGRSVLLDSDAVHVRPSQVVHSRCVSRIGELPVDRECLAAVPGHSVAVLVAPAELLGGRRVSRLGLLLEHGGPAVPVAAGAHAVEDADGPHAACGVVTCLGGRGVIRESARRVELRAHGELLQPAQNVGRVGILCARPLPEVFEDDAVFRRLVRLVIVGQPSVRLRVALHACAEHPHAALRRVSWDRQAVGVAVAYDELGPGMTPFGCADVPTEGGRLVRIDALAECEPLPKLEAGLHVPCLGLGYDILNGFHRA